jgi:hypothetical protein
MAFQEETYSSSARSREGDGLLVTGLFLFAAVLMLIAGSFHVIQGLAALLDDGFIPSSIDNYAYDIDIQAWGWMHILTGIVLAVAGAGLLSGALWARLLALFIVVVSGIINFVYIPYQPLWSIVQLTLCGLVIWALLSYQMTDEDF